jgi:DNA-binding response OmpR family regulator
MTVVMGQKSVLVVEDDVTINETVCAILEVEGYRALCVTNLTQARRALLDETPSAVLLDLMLNDEESGETLLDELAGRPGAPPVVVFSASPHAELVAKTFAVDLVAKPFDVDDLLEALARGIAAHRVPTRA